MQDNVSQYLRARLHRLEVLGDGLASEFPGLVLGRFRMCCALEGECRVIDRRMAVVGRLSAGDVLIFPTISPVSRELYEGDGSVMDDWEAGGRLRLKRTDGQTGCRLLLLDGDVEFGGQRFHPLITGIAGMSQIRQAELRKTGTVRHCGYMIDEEYCDGNGPPSPLLDRLFEVLVIQFIEAYYAAVGREYLFMHALQEPVITRAIQAIHERPGHNWSLERLAAVAGVSRSTFSRLFTKRVGVSAMHYLTRWRMHRALEHLRSNHQDLASVAHEAGYVSATAFHKAFKRVHGVTPAQAVEAENR